MKTLGAILRSRAKYFVTLIVGLAFIIFSGSKFLAFFGVSTATMKEIGLGAVLVVLFIGGIVTVIYSLDKMFPSS